MIVNIILSKVQLPEEVPFFCMRCRSRLFMVNRDILAVWMGEGYPSRDIPRNMGWVQLRCHSCKTNWNFYWQ